MMKPGGVDSLTLNEARKRSLFDLEVEARKSGLFDLEAEARKSGDEARSLTLNVNQEEQIS